MSDEIEKLLEKNGFYWDGELDVYLHPSGIAVSGLEVAQNGDPESLQALIDCRFESVERQRK